ncbi:hypothetical protein YPPY47_0723, partial [Yersinia pestis PY-47]
MMPAEDRKNGSRW